MAEYRPKLHPSSCFPPNPSVPSIQNRLFLRIAPIENRRDHFRLTFVGINDTTYSAIAALLTYGQSTSIKHVKLFDRYQKHETRVILNDLQSIALFTRNNIHLERVQSYWETRDSNIIIINVQHNQLENESISTWIQINASLVETIVSQVCSHSPNATLIICTQPNELMTYVASRVSRFPVDRVIGLGASIATAYAHRSILNRIENVHGHVNGFFIIGGGSMNDSCSKVLMNNLTIDGIPCSNIHANLNENHSISKNIQNRNKLKQDKQTEWNIEKLLENNQTIYSNVRRRLPIVTDLISRQAIATKYLLSNSIMPRLEFKSEQSINMPFNTKLRSNWTEAMLIVQMIRALINGKEFQSNFVVNIAPINNSATNVFINYPVIIGSSNRSIEYMFLSHQVQNIFNEKSFLISYEKLQRKIQLLKSKD